MIQFPESNLKKSFLAHVQAIVGDPGFSQSPIDRLSYCRDANFRDAIGAHYSHFENFPSIIVWPETSEQVAQLIKIAQQFKIAVTPYGGGSGVCGGAIAYNGGMTLDMKKMSKVLRVDEERLFVDVQAGILGLELEKQLERRGYTLGHFPSSILSACLGGYLAARSAGQLSSKYGKIEDMTIDFKFVDGHGRIIRTSDVSRNRGLDLSQMIIGSEGTLGVITEVRLKIYPKPTQRRFKAYTFKKIEYGIEAMRRIMQSGLKPDVLRLYDPLDSALVFSKMSKSNKDLPSLSDNMPSTLKKALKKLESTSMHMAFRAHRLINESARFSWLGCIFVIMLEGHEKLMIQDEKIITAICKDLDAKDIGEEAAHYWYKHRYSVSYKASKLFNDGAFTDTMEVATSWDNLANLYFGVANRLKKHCLVLAHISHVYNEGAAIYFTIVAPLSGLKRSQSRYDKIWDEALNAVRIYGGILSHHHGIGRLKKAHIRQEWGEARHLFELLKAEFDPSHILNPEVLYE